MRGELDHGTRGAFDLKQGVGGIADGEFMLQYALLRDSARHPELADVSGTRAQLAALVAAGTVAAQDAGTLAAALAALRARLNHRVLQEQPTTVPARELREARARIRALWRHWFEQRISPMREHP